MSRGAWQPSPLVPEAGASGSPVQVQCPFLGKLGRDCWGPASSFPSCGRGPPGCGASATQESPCLWQVLVRPLSARGSSASVGPDTLSLDRCPRSSSAVAAPHLVVAVCLRRGGPGVPTVTSAIRSSVRARRGPWLGLRSARSLLCRVSGQHRLLTALTQALGASRWKRQAGCAFKR